VTALPLGLEVRVHPRTGGGYVVRCTWKADRKRRLEFALPDTTPLRLRGHLVEALTPGATGGATLDLTPRQRGRPSGQPTPTMRRFKFQQRRDAFLNKNPGQGVIVARTPPDLALVGLEPGAVWTPRRARAASAILAELGIGLTVAWVPGRGHQPDRYLTKMAGAWRAVEWGDEREKLVIVVPVPPAPQILLEEHGAERAIA
jgi:hypothetical protein